MDGRRGSSGRRNTALVRFVVLVLGVLVIGLLFGFLLGRIGANRGEGAPPPTPRTRTVTVEKTVPGPEKTIEKTIPGPEKPVRETTTTTSASATASP
jgi:hypothetical protein